MFLLSTSDVPSDFGNGFALENVHGLATKVNALYASCNSSLLEERSMQRHNGQLRRFSSLMDIFVLTQRLQATGKIAPRVVGAHQEYNVAQ